MKSLVSYGFVVLHYMAYEMTVECVNELIKCFSAYNIHIAVVDNASPNGSGSKLLESYNDSSYVDVIINGKNDGFARGNNLGYDFLRKTYDPDFLIIMNNDVMIRQTDFLDVISKIYEEDEYAVLGPDIFCPSENIHQNPAHERGFTQEEVQKLYHMLNLRVRYPMFYYLRHRLLGHLKYQLQKTKGNNKKENPAENVVLHGACYIFSRRFMEMRTYCFRPDTFLYLEEDILHFECLRSNLKMMYSPDLCVTHLEDVSTNLSMGMGYNKWKMKNKEMMKSVEIFLVLIRGGIV